MEPGIPNPGIPSTHPVRFPSPDKSDANDRKDAGHIGGHSVRRSETGALSSAGSPDRTSVARAVGDPSHPSKASKVRRAKAPKTKIGPQQGGAKADDGARLAPSERVDRQKITASLDGVRKTGELLNPLPARQAARETPARNRLGELAGDYGQLVPLLEKAAAMKLIIAGRGPGDISLHLGPMAYPIDLAPVASELREKSEIPPDSSV